MIAKRLPNVPYILAVPGNKWGDEYDMTGEPLVSGTTHQRLRQEIRKESGGAHRRIRCPVAQRDAPALPTLLRLC